MLVTVPRFYFLQVSGVGQQNARQIDRRGSGVNRAFVTQSHKLRQIAGVIDVRVRQNDGVYRTRVDGRLRPVPETQVLRSLEQAAIDEYPAVHRFEKKL